MADEVSAESPAEVLAQEFFFSGTVPSSTHEEWLLRLCAQLMHREAHVISMMEASAVRPPQRRSDKSRSQWRDSSNASRGSSNA